MDKISFIIPDNNKNELTNDLKDNPHEKQRNSSNYSKNTYVKIAPNVYTFSSELHYKDNIYVHYSNACQVKKENKFTAINMFKTCLKLINNDTKIDIKYEIFINLALLVSETGGNYNEVSNYYEEALHICPDRSEPYYYWSIYCNKQHKFEKSYELLHKALLLSYSEAVIKYPTTQMTSYGKYLYYELSVACSWLKKYDESIIYLEQIIEDPEFSVSRERNLNNLNIIKQNMNI